MHPLDHFENCMLKELKNVLTKKNCPVCARTAKEHTRKEMNECYAKYLEKLKVKLNE